MGVLCVSNCLTTNDDLENFSIESLYAMANLVIFCFVQHEPTRGISKV